MRPVRRFFAYMQPCMYILHKYAHSFLPLAPLPDFCYNEGINRKDLPI